MTEYIERDAVATMIESAQIISNGENCGYCTDDISIYSIPAADVELVRHGRWIKYAGKLVCSECKRYPPMKDESGGWRTHHEWPYCPNCGAKMGLECETQ